MLSTADLLVLTSLDQLIFILKIVFTLIKKQATLIRRSTVLSFPPQLVFPALTIDLARVLTLIRCLIYHLWSMQ